MLGVVFASLLGTTPQPMFLARQSNSKQITINISNYQLQFNEGCAIFYFEIRMNDGFGGNNNSVAGGNVSDPIKSAWFTSRIFIVGRQYRFKFFETISASDLDKHISTVCDAVTTQY